MWYKVKYGVLISLQYTGHGQSGSIVIEDDGLSDSGYSITLRSRIWLGLNKGVGSRPSLVDWSRCHIALYHGGSSCKVSPV